MNKRVRDFVLGELSRREYGKVSIVGHSLGGALAILCAHELGMARRDLPFYVHTFGCPRAVNRAFSVQLSSLANVHIVRYLNGLDPVGRIPFSYLGFRHVGRCIYLNTARRRVEPPRPWGHQPLRANLYRIELGMGLATGIGQHEMESYVAHMEHFDWAPYEREARRTVQATTENTSERAGPRLRRRTSIGSSRREAPSRRPSTIGRRRSSEVVG